MSKRAAFEKELLTLEKDKEDQSKYYLSYSKPLVLDMKQANCHINVVEWVNFPKFSALDDLEIQTSRIIFWDHCDVLVDMILCYIKLYSRESRH